MRSYKNKVSSAGGRDAPCKTCDEEAYLLGPPRQEQQGQPLIVGAVVPRLMGARFHYPIHIKTLSRPSGRYSTPPGEWVSNVLQDRMFPFLDD